MLLMKKDMGGAAAAMTLARLIMGAGLDVRLRLLIPSAENSIAGDAFRPGDVLTSRAGKTVEIGNTDAEGGSCWQMPLSLADDEAPDTMLVFATLTGAARAALGPDLPAMFTDDEEFAYWGCSPPPRQLAIRFGVCPSGPATSAISTARSPT